jgi:hypothetical protein
MGRFQNELSKLVTFLNLDGECDAARVAAAPMAKRGEQAAALQSPPLLATDL